MWFITTNILAMYLEYLKCETHICESDNELILKLCEMLNMPHGAAEEPDIHKRRSSLRGALSPPNEKPIIILVSFFYITKAFLSQEQLAVSYEKVHTLRTKVQHLAEVASSSVQYILLLDAGDLANLKSFNICESQCILSVF